MVGGGVSLLASVAVRWRVAGQQAHQALGSVRVWRERCDVRGMVPWVGVWFGHRSPPPLVQLCRDGVRRVGVTRGCS